jgi:hypothetical protein
MKYYIYTTDSDTYHTLNLVAPSSFKDLYKITGKPLGSLWKPVSVASYLVTRAGDFPHLSSHVPVFTSHAMSSLGALIEPFVERLPLNSTTPGLCGLTALNVQSLDCLDHERADVEYLPNGKPIYVDTYAFHAEVVKERPIFRVQHLELTRCFVSEAFRKTVLKAGLQGLIFKPV